MHEERPVRPMASEAWEGNAHVANLEALMLRLLSPLGPDEDWPERRDLGLALCGAIRAEIAEAIALDVAGIEPQVFLQGTQLPPVSFSSGLVREALAELEAAQITGPALYVAGHRDALGAVRARLFGAEG